MLLFYPFSGPRTDRMTHEANDRNFPEEAIAVLEISSLRQQRIASSRTAINCLIMAISFLTQDVQNEN
jgi:hypothetical protein